MENHRSSTAEVSSQGLPSRTAAGLVALALAAALLVLDGTPAHAAIVPPVPLGTAAGYAVLAASTVTNTGESTLYGTWACRRAPTGTSTPPPARSWPARP